MNKRLMIFLAALMLISALCGCTAQKKQPGKNTFDDIQINPGADAAKSETLGVTLYYMSSSGTMLAGEARRISAPVNDRVETSILEELIKGPATPGNSFGMLINPDTKVLSISDSGDVLTVVLSADFLAWPFDESADEDGMMKKLAIYSIVNTLVEASGFPRVQLLVDRDSTGLGQRIQLSDLGGGSSMTADSSDVLGSLARNGDIVLTPKNTVNEIMRSMTVKDFDAIYEYLAYSDKYGYSRPDEAAFSAALGDAPSVEGYSIGDEIVSDDGQSAVVMTDYTLRFGEGETVTRTGVPAALVKENGVWRQRYSAFEALFITPEGEG